MRGAGHRDQGDKIPGQTVTEVERRYGRRGTEVLERLRTAKRGRGRIASEDVDAIAAELGLPRAHVNAAASFYADLGFAPRGRRHVEVCDGTACFAASRGAHVRDMSAALGAEPDGVSADGSDSLQPVYCLGYCYGGPAALADELPHAGPDLVEQLTGDAERRDPEIPFRASTPEPVVLSGLEGDGPDPWDAWRDAVAVGDRGRVTTEVVGSGLRGRGGAGFPAGTKWASVAESAARGPRYVVCNGDEGDPGSFVDRLLMESDPHRILAGMALAGYAIGAEHGYVYVRSEYPRARDALRRAVAEARDAGHLRANGGGARFDVEVFEGAGSYVAGEETSLIHSMEGLRGEVARRPPYPTEHGFLHRPTVVNNVETLCAVPWIVTHGADAYSKLGAGGSKGTKVVCLNERFNRPGAYEVELGVGLRYVFEELGGGLRDGHVLRSLQVGGPLGGFIGPEHLDMPLAFDALQAAGADLGHGSLVAIDEHVPAHELYLHMWRFAAGESCGTCAPCRVGTRRGLEAARRQVEGDPPDATTLDSLLETMRRGSLCAFGKSVPGVVRSLVGVYADELGAERRK